MLMGMHEKLGLYVQQGWILGYRLRNIVHLKVILAGHYINCGKD